MVKVLRPREGQDVLEALKEFAEKNSITFAEISGASGKIRDFEISGFQGQGSIENKTSSMPHDIQAISGKIQNARNKTEAYVKLQVSRPGLTPIQGVLINGKACSGLEINIRDIDLSKIIEG